MVGSSDVQRLLKLNDGDKQDGRIRAWLLDGTWSDRIQQWLSIGIQLAILGLLIGALVEQRWLVAFTAAVVLTLTFLPAVIERRFNLQLPIEFTLLTSLFLYASFGLGEVSQFYRRFWWWDILLHSISAIVIGLIGFLLVFALYMTYRMRIAPFYLALVSFSFAMTAGSLWEIFEFTMDWAFGLNMQKSGLVDTMTDLMVDALGGVMAAWIGYQYIKKGEPWFANHLIRRVVAKNPRLFRERVHADRGPGERQQYEDDPASARGSGLGG